ncbi:Coiled-coil domain-containing protein lobo [Frankliniella fusca]|uniref:Coiled-coil domain-containing protein lobo n=1 Tax=Frankliniella fusca TaxID=407009 RepID=A0AAE1GU05_9NEOP|nr:Coiled-coil domain-containing protein lobo [Frankliniella fusca]
MEDTESVLVSVKDSFQERGKLFSGGDGDASFTSIRNSHAGRKKGSSQSSSTVYSHDEAQQVINPQRLREIALELGVIKLCWPESNIQNERKYYPTSFSENSNKEKLLMWYAENFRQQFHHEFPNRRPLLLAVENECGLQEIRNVTGKPKWAQQK